MPLISRVQISQAISVCQFSRAMNKKRGRPNKNIIEPLDVSPDDLAAFVMTTPHPSWVKGKKQLEAAESTTKTPTK